MATSEQHEEVAAIKAVQDGEADLKLVGYYCAGGHPIDGHEGIASPSLRFDDPCEFGVPVFVLTKDNPRVEITSGCRTERWKWSQLKDWINMWVRVTAKHPDHPEDEPDQYEGLVVYVSDSRLQILPRHGEAIHLDRYQILKVEQIDPRKSATDVRA